MDRISDLLIAVWREVCRHLEIGESVETLAPLLAKQMTMSILLIRRLDAERSLLDTVAEGSRDGAPPPALKKTELAPGRMAPLLAWFRRGRVFHVGDGDTPRDLWGAVPAGLDGDVMAGPLGPPGDPTGLLLVAAAPPTAFAERDREIMRRLVEPFSVALDNDRRLREIRALREAAEADRRSLLVKLGRGEIADVIVGEDGGLRSVMERVALVARSDAPVLILGDTGTGKEVIARAIHVRSRRAGGPFLRVNCGAIPHELVDSQLFGHERGAFTGAVEQRKGWFERADGGTLFLDEIGELPPGAQVRLLRVLQDGWLDRVGGHESVRVDVRIVAATHQDLAAMVAARAFREDLWYRVAVFPILLPRLRERAEDIPALARHLAAKAATRLGLPLAMPTDDDVAVLTTYAWPGNVREMAAVIDRAAILGNGHRLEIAKSLGISAYGPRQAADESAPAPPPPARTERYPTLDAAAKQHIEQALRKTLGRVEGPFGAARLLAINPHTLRGRMRKLGIRWREFRSVPRPASSP
jgi:transcriptional regulator with GAF, ATPase, and Fis domain